MLGFFFLGYYVGKYQSKGGSTAESLPPLPEVVSKSLPKPEEFTFYKTLTEKDNKTVSIDLKPKPSPESKPERKETAVAPKEHDQPAVKEKSAEGKAEKKSVPAEETKQTAPKPSPAPEKKTASIKQPASSKLRYTIQVSSHQEKQAAEDEVKRMKQNGFAAFIVASELPGKGTWYRVRLGSFTNRDAAEKLQKSVNAKVGISSIIVIE
jgi:cell division septation protein DedD